MSHSWWLLCWGPDKERLHHCISSSDRTDTRADSRPPNNTGLNYACPPEHRCFSVNVQWTVSRGCKSVDSTNHRSQRAHSLSHGWEPPCIVVRTHWCSLLRIRDLSSVDFGICRGSWNQSPADAEERRKPHMTFLLHAWCGEGIGPPRHCVELRSTVDRYPRCI